MLFFTTAMKNHTLTFVKLSDCMDDLETAAKWAEEEWGYLRNHPGLEFRKNLFQEKFQSILYISFYNEQPVAMFSLENHKDPLLKTCKLSYVYVQQEYRGLGFGKQIIDKAKSLASDEKACIVLDTLKPGLNALYMKHGARLVCESRLLGEPLEVFRMSP